MGSPHCAEISISTVLQEISNFEEFTLPGNFSAFGVPDTSIATCQEKSWPKYVTCGVSREVRTLIFNGTRL